MPASFALRPIFGCGRIIVWVLIHECNDEIPSRIPWPASASPPPDAPAPDAPAPPNAPRSPPALRPVTAPPVAPPTFFFKCESERRKKNRKRVRRVFFLATVRLQIKVKPQINQRLNVTFIAHWKSSKVNKKKSGPEIQFNFNIHTS